jgi:hypothetical protein
MATTPKAPPAVAAPMALFGKLSKDANALMNARLPIKGVEVSDVTDPKQMMRMSEALGNVGAEGKTLNITQADRSRVFGPNKGGTGFSGMTLDVPEHAKAKSVWGVGKPSHVTRLINQNTPDTIWSTFIGSPTQHMSNPVVLQRMLEEFAKGNPSPELIAKINARLPEGVDIRDPRIMDNLKTFDDRKAAAKLLTMGGSKKGEQATKNAFRVIDEETDALVKDSPTYSVGPRLFELDNTRMYRPDLNESFPYQVGGTDYGLHYEPAPVGLVMPEFSARYEGRLNKKGKPQPMGHKDLSATTPKQFISHDLLMDMSREGYAEGGAIGMAEGGGRMAMLNAMMRLKAEADAALKARRAAPTLVKSDRVEAMRDILPADVAAANKEAFLAKSKDPRRFYHGTKQDIREFKPRTAQTTFLTPDPKFADDFAFEGQAETGRLGPEQINRANVMPVRVQVENPFDPDHREQMQLLQDKLNEMYPRETAGYDIDGNKLSPEEFNKQMARTHGVADAWNNYHLLKGSSLNNWQQIEHPSIQAALRKMGHDAYYSTEGGVKNLGVYNPKRIKSDIGNTGAYDIEDADISKKDGGWVYG